MKKLVTVGLSILAANLLTAPLAIAGSPSVVGSWNVTFYLETARSIGATQCIVFTQVPGTVAGVPTSGTWSSPSFPGWSGQWVQLGDHVRWFGNTGSLATTESGNMTYSTIFGGVSFNHYNSTTGVTSSAGSWQGVKVPVCRGTVETSPDGDPSHRMA